MKNSLLLLLVPIAIGMSACANAQWGRNRDRDTEKITEDLSAVRPKFSDPVDTTKHYQGNPVRNVPLVTPTNTVNAKVNIVLDSIDRINASKLFIQGYTIQVYSGLSRDEAGNARKRMLEELSMRSDLEYVQPKFRVRVGTYFNAMEAQKDMVKLKRIFPNAILVPEKVAVK